MRERRHRLGSGKRKSTGNIERCTRNSTNSLPLPSLFLSLQSSSHTVVPRGCPKGDREKMQQAAADGLRLHHYAAKGKGKGRGRPRRGNRVASDLDAADQSAAAAAEVLRPRGLALLGIGKGKDIGKGKGEDKGKGASRGKGKGKDANVDDDSDQTGPRPETMSNDDERETMSLTTYYVGSPRGGRRLARVREYAGRPDPCAEQSSWRAA